MRILYVALQVLLTASLATAACSTWYCTTVVGPEVLTAFRTFAFVKLTRQPGVYDDLNIDTGGSGSPDNHCAITGYTGLATIRTQAERNALVNAMLANGQLTSQNVMLDVQQYRVPGQWGSWYYGDVAGNPLFVDSNKNCLGYCPDFANWGNQYQSSYGRHLRLTASGVVQVENPVGLENHILCYRSASPGAWNSPVFSGQTGFVDGHIFQLYTLPTGTEVSAELVKGFCATVGKSLASIRTAAQQAAVNALNPYYPYYLSGSDAASEGTWRWNPDWNNPFYNGGCTNEYCNFRAGEPNGGTGENWLIGLGTADAPATGQWIDVPWSWGASSILCQEHSRTGSQIRLFGYYPKKSVSRDVAASDCATNGGWLATASTSSEWYSMTVLAPSQWSWLGGKYDPVTAAWFWAYGPKEEYFRFFNEGTMTPVSQVFSYFHAGEPNGGNT